MPVGHLYVFSGENVSLGLLSIFCLGCLFLLLSCMSCLLILEIKPLSVSSFANIFSHSVGCIFILVLLFGLFYFIMVYFAVGLIGCRFFHFIVFNMLCHSPSL